MTNPFGNNPETVFANLMRLRGALHLEVKTGMSNSKGSTMNMVRSICVEDTEGNYIPITNKRTKKGVLADFDKWLKTQYPHIRSF